MEIGRRIGVENFYKYLKAYGFTEKTGIDIQGESKGIVMNQKNCGPVELATQSFGQASAYTPIQLVMASIAATNGGTLLQPYILKEIHNYTDEILFTNQKKVKRKVISEKTFDLLPDDEKRDVLIYAENDLFTESVILKCLNCDYD